jgi:hypothetical protein
MMKRKSLANLTSVVLIALAMLFAGCIGEETTSEVEEFNVAPGSVGESSESIAEMELEFELYRNDEFGYSISYPEDWVIRTNVERDMEKPDSERGMERPDLEGEMEIPDMEEGMEKPDIEGDMERPNSEGNVERPIFGGDMQGGIFFEEPESGTMLMVSVISEYDIDELKASGAEEIVVNGREAYATIIQLMPEIKMKLVVFPADDKYYVVSGNAPSELFDQYADAFDTSINSFAIET